MISLSEVTDQPVIFGERQLLLLNADIHIPRGRYGLLSATPELHRALIDILAGLRPPRRGLVQHSGLVSWPMGRQGFIRGKGSGLNVIHLICELYGANKKLCIELVSDLLSSPDYLSKPMSDWPLYTKQEFSFALALAPDFDIYVIEGAIPFESYRFTRLWRALFEERLPGRTLILSTYRHSQMSDYCTKGLIYERNGFRIDEIDDCIQHFPARQSRSDSANQAGYSFSEQSTIEEQLFS